MIKNIYLIIASFVILSCQLKHVPNESFDQAMKDQSQEINYNYTSASNLFSLRDAEKILGQPTRLKDSVSIVKAEVSAYNSSYTANVPDEETEKTGNIYFMFEQYKQVESAKNEYASIKKANENHEGVKVLQDLGDEAYFHSDGENFYFILVRKGEKMFRMKVNKITGTTSLEEFNRVAREISDKL